MVDFYQLTDPLKRIGNLKDMSLAPLINSLTLASFESYAYEVFANLEEYPKNFGTSSIGKGVYSIDKNGKAYHDTEGATNFSNHKVIVPSFNCVACAAMYNMHSERRRGLTIDSVINSFASGIRNSSAVTPFLQLLVDPVTRPAAILFYPIAPSKNKTVLVGFIRITQNWDSILSDSIPQGSCGIDIVMSDGTLQYTFTALGDKLVRFKGSGDLHDPTYKMYCTTLLKFSNLGYEIYSIKICPNSEYFPSNVFLMPSIVCVAIVLFLMLLKLSFEVYNFYLHQQLKQKQEALDSKRSFVRLISHEIRTPLNTVCMGLKLLQEEAQTSVDVKLLTSLLTDQVDSESIGDVTSPVNSPPEGETTERVKAEAMLVALLTKHKKWQELLKDIEESSNNAVDVLNELISYDKIEMKTLHIERELLPVWSLIASSVKPFYIQARERGLHMQLTMDGGNSYSDTEEGTTAMLCAFPAVSEDRMRQLEKLYVLGDPMRLAQVFRNVISNALKFSYPGTAVSIRAVWCPDNIIETGKQRCAYCFL